LVANASLTYSISLSPKCGDDNQTLLTRKKCFKNVNNYFFKN